MLTSWFNGSSDLSWMSRWRPTVVLPAYRRGSRSISSFGTAVPKRRLQTPHGPACGRAYACRARFSTTCAFLLARLRAPAGPLYVTLFAEFETYPCLDNAWSPGPSDDGVLRDAQGSVPRGAGDLPGGGTERSRVARVGRLAGEWSDPRSAAAVRSSGTSRTSCGSSGFQSFQSLEAPDAIRHATAMTRVLGRYGPVMLAFYKPAGATPAAQRAALSSFLSPANLAALPGWSLRAELHGHVLLAGPGVAQARRVRGESFRLHRLRPALTRGGRGGTQVPCLARRRAGGLRSNQPLW